VDAIAAQASGQSDTLQVAQQRGAGDRIALLPSSPHRAFQPLGSNCLRGTLCGEMRAAVVPPELFCCSILAVRKPGYCRTPLYYHISLQHCRTLLDQENNH